MIVEQQYVHWQLKLDGNNILWLTLDCNGASVNTLSSEVFNELSCIIHGIASQKPVALIIRSGKSKGFIAGADIRQFTELKSSDEAYDLIRSVQVILNKLSQLDITTVAMIDGFCLGGGTELALACDYRVASDSVATKIGLPEVKLGIHPGWGGTIRAPQVMGVPAAMKLMLTGAPLTAKKAQRAGLVDAAVPLRQLARAATYFALNRPKKQRPRLFLKMMNWRFIRPLVARSLYQTLHQKNVIENHYPAPYAMVRNWARDGTYGDAMVNEAKSIAQLMMTTTARHLVRIFFLQTEMKAVATGATISPTHVHVIGAGTMGGDIAAWCAYKGFYVTLEDQTADKIAPAIKRAASLYGKKFKQSHLMQAALDRLQPDVAGYGLAKADIIIEAVFEEIKIKHQVLQKIEQQARSDAIIATNTSSLALSEIAQGLSDPDRLIGLHFFNPVAKMPLVEVVRGANTPDTLIANAAYFITRLSRSPLVVKDRPGFLVNRILMPYLMEAMLLLSEGVSAENIDKIAVSFGMPMGPITLADTVGLDICLHVATSLTSSLGGEVPDKLKQMVASGQLGVKSGQGFYCYKNGRKITAKEVTTNASISEVDLTDRLILSMINEAVTCLHESIVPNADALDIGMIFGTGFAPFRGGPMQYIQQRTADTIVPRLQVLSQQYGERFKPQPGWDALLSSEVAVTKN